MADSRLHDAILELADHIERTVQQIAKIIGQIGVDALDQSITRKIAILPQIDLTQQEIPDGIGAKLIDKCQWIDDIALGLAHLIPINNEPAMTIDLLRQWQIKCHEDTRPDDGMETHDFLADKMKIRRPEFLKHLRIIQIADWRQIIRQRIKPYVDDMLLINRHRDTPVKRSTGNAEILQPLLDEIDHLIAAGRRLDEIRMVFDILQHLIRIF